MSKRQKRKPMSADTPKSTELTVQGVTLFIDSAVAAGKPGTGQTIYISSQSPVPIPATDIETSTPPVQEEQVLCFPRTVLTQAGDFEGLSLDVLHYLTAINSHTTGYVTRTEAETDFTLKQLIPYVILRTQDGRIFRYRRGAGGGEARLHGLYSIGVGGHISATDKVESDLNYRASMHRELEEELGSQVVVLDEQAVAVINEELNPVGQVHFGVVHVVTVENPEAVVGEFGAVTESAFVTMEELLTDLSQYEGWSRICLSYIHELLHRHQQACLTAWLQRDSSLQAAFADRPGQDRHDIIAYEVLGQAAGYTWEDFLTLLRSPGLPGSRDVRDMRSRCKHITLSLPCEPTAYDFARVAGLSQDSADALLEQYFIRFPQLSPNPEKWKEVIKIGKVLDDAAGPFSESL